MQKSVKELIFDLSSDIEEVRKVAIIWLAQVGDDAVLPELRRMTQDPSTAIRYFARRAIDTIEKRVKGGAGPSQPAAPQTRIQVEDWRAKLAQEDPAARLAAAQALSKLDEMQARGLVRMALPAEAEPGVKGALLAVLAQHKNEADLDLIFAELSDANPAVRADAVLALESFYHPSIRDRLLPLVRDPDNRTRANVLLVLGRYDADLIAGPLAEMATSREIWNKDSALWVLRRLRTPRAVELLGRMHAENRSDSYLFPKVDAALRELAAKGDEAAVKVLASLEAGRFEKTEGKLELDRVLDDIESEVDDDGRDKRAKRVEITTVSAFESAIEDADFEQRLAAVDAGVRLDPIAAAMAFRARLPHEQHPFVISKMIKELGRVGGPADVDLIAGQLGHPDARVRANAIEGLALLGGETLYERIKPLLEDASPRVQATAAKVVYAIDRDRAFRKLKAMIASRETAVSDAAVHALGDVHADDVLELLEIALGQDDQELRLKIFRVLQRLSAKSPIAASIYARYREEGDGVLLKSGDLAHSVGVAADTSSNSRLQAIKVLRESADARAQAALEKLARDRDQNVKREAMAALRVRDLELERGVMLYQLGSVLYRSWKRGELENPELDAAFDKVEKHGQSLDQGGDPAGVLTYRALAMAEAGRRSLDLVNDFALKHRARGPRPGDAQTDELTVDDLPALAAKIGQVDRKMEERLQAFYNELAVSPSAPPPPRVASGKISAPPVLDVAPAVDPTDTFHSDATAVGMTRPKAVRGLPSLDVTPSDELAGAHTPPEGVPVLEPDHATRRVERRAEREPEPVAPEPVAESPAPEPELLPHAASDADLPPMRSTAGAEPRSHERAASAPDLPPLRHAATEADLPPLKHAASAEDLPPLKSAAASSGAMAALGGEQMARAARSRALKAPSGALSAPIDAPKMSVGDSSFALVRAWFQQNPALAAIGGALAVVMMLVVIASSMGQETFKGGWKAKVNDPVRLELSGDTVLALSGSGALTGLSLATGKEEWKFTGPSLEGSFPIQVDAGMAYLSGSDGRVVAVNVRTGKKAWDATLGSLVAAPMPANGKLVALSKDPFVLTLLDARSGAKGATFTAGSDVLAAVPALNGVVIVRKKGLTLLEPGIKKSLWDLVLPAEVSPTAHPFELGGNLMLLANDILLCLSKDGNKVWERRVEPGATVLPGPAGRKEVFVVAKKFVEVIDATGKGGSTAAMSIQWTNVEVGKSDVLLSDAEGGLHLLDMREKTSRKLADLKEPVRALSRSNYIGLAAVADRVEAVALALPKN